MIRKNTAGLAEERLERIRELLDERGAARVGQLCDRVGVSPATVRRDLQELHRRGLVRRVHGGAVLVGSRLDEPLFDDKAAIAAAEKERIAAAALRFIKPNDSVFLDGGSTVLAVARLLVEMNRVTVVTNSLGVISVLSSAGPRVIAVGGEFRRLSRTFVGPLTQAVIDKLKVDVAFMGTIGLSTTDGMTTTDPREAYTKELVMSHAGKVVLLADSSKIGKVSFVRFDNMENVDALVTDKKVRRADVNKFKKKGMEVVAV